MAYHQVPIMELGSRIVGLERSGERVVSVYPSNTEQDVMVVLTRSASAPVEERAS